MLEVIGGNRVYEMIKSYHANTLLQVEFQEISQLVSDSS